MTRRAPALGRMYFPAQDSIACDDQRRRLHYRKFNFMKKNYITQITKWTTKRCDMKSVFCHLNKANHQMINIHIEKWQ